MYGFPSWTVELMVDAHISGKTSQIQGGGVLKRPWLDPTLSFTRWGQNPEGRRQRLEGGGLGLEAWPLAPG